MRFEPLMSASQLLTHYTIQAINVSVSYYKYDLSVQHYIYICSQWLHTFHHKIQCADYDIPNGSKLKVTMLNETSNMSSYM